MLEQVQEFSSEKAAHHANRKEEIVACSDPLVSFQATPSNDAMDVWMIHQCLGPGMQDSQDSDFRAEMFGICCQGEEGLGGSTEEEGITTSLVRAKEVVEFTRDGKDHVEVWDGQQIGLSAVQPAFGGKELAGGTVSVAAGVEDVVLRAAMITFVEMAT